MKDLKRIKSPKSLKVVSFHPAVYFKWKLEDSCGICQMDFEYKCENCKHPLNCIPCIGQCHHIFHEHCIDRWLKNENRCPVCRKDWVIINRMNGFE